MGMNIFWRGIEIQQIDEFSDDNKYWVSENGHPKYYKRWWPVWTLEAALEFLNDKQVSAER